MNWRRLFKRQPPKPVPHWEAVADPPHKDDATQGVFWRVRWSEPGKDGGWLYVRHYGGNGTGWNKSAAERNAEDFNRERRHPSEWDCWRPVEPASPLMNKIDEAIFWTWVLILVFVIAAVLFAIATIGNA